MGAREARRLIEEHGVKGFKFHPTVQGFYPHDRMAWPIYEVVAEYGMPAIFHSGHSGIGSGMRCGGGLRLRELQSDAPGRRRDRLSRHADRDRPPVLAMAGRGAVGGDAQAQRLDRSFRLEPKYFPPQLVQYANTLLKDRVLFGRDYPLITPERWMKDFEEAGFKDEVRPLILKENAVRLLRL